MTLAVQASLSSKEVPRTTNKKLQEERPPTASDSRSHALQLPLQTTATAAAAAATTTTAKPNDGGGGGGGGGCVDEDDDDDDDDDDAPPSPQISCMY